MHNALSVRKTAARILILAMLLAFLVPAAAYATTSQEESAAPAYTPAFGHVGPSFVPGLAADWEPTVSDIPDSFDLRDVGGSNYVSPVKDQNGLNTSWAYGILASIESNLLMKGYTEYHDLSELHLAYYTYTRSADVAAQGGGTNGDTVDISALGVNALDIGGNDIMARTALSSWLGPIQESDMDIGVALTGSSPVSSGQILAALDQLGSEYARSKNAVQLEYVYEVDMVSHPQAVKALLMDSGAASISFAYDAQYDHGPNGSGNYYCNRNPYYNYHAVALCGWDDNYDPGNFGAVQPSSPGAWLCKNSWGTGYGDNGFFWISYEDASLSGAYFYGAVPSEDGFDNIYQYDGGLSISNSIYNAGPLKCANMFQSTRDETLSAVRLELIDPGAEITVSIYTGCSAADPESGTLKSSTSYKCNYSGAHTISLSSPVPLERGESFSIVVTVYTGDGVMANMMADVPAPDSSPALSQGNSFIVKIDEWSVYHYDICIKALTNDREFVPSGAFGDVNGNGITEVKDALLLAAHLAGMSELSPAQLQVADVDVSDGDLSTADIRAICRYLAGLDN